MMQKVRINNKNCKNCFLHTKFWVLCTTTSYGFFSNFPSQYCYTIDCIYL